jgi:isoleucyl-tRNA synthetase
LIRSNRRKIEAVSSLIKHEVNIKEIELLEDASDILVKQIKPNFKVLGPRFGKDMKLISSADKCVFGSRHQKNRAKWCFRR